jgi:hypothetical protein
MAILYSNVDAIAPTRVVIEEQSVSAAMFTTVTIPAGYRTIELVLSGLRSPASAYFDVVVFTFNGNTTDADYLGFYEGSRWNNNDGWDAAGAEYNQRPNMNIPAVTGRATDENPGVLTLTDYAQTTYYKSSKLDKWGDLEVQAGIPYYRYFWHHIHTFPSTGALTSVAFSLTSGQAALATGRLQVVGYK